MCLASMPYRNREQLKAYQKEWIKARRGAWLKENGPCRKCGSWDRLEVDHIDPEQKVSHRIWSWSETRRLVELAKCQPLCFLCHRDKSLVSRKTAMHGNRAMYKQGCRCRACRLGNSFYVRFGNWRRLSITETPSQPSSSCAQCPGKCVSRFSESSSCPCDQRASPSSPDQLPV